CSPGPQGAVHCCRIGPRIIHYTPPIPASREHFMSAEKTPSAQHVTDLYQSFAGGRVSRREFMRQATALGIAGAAAAALGPLAARPGEAATLAQLTLATQSSAKILLLDLAEWSYMWVNVKRDEVANRTFVGGQQMYVEYM